MKSIQSALVIFIAVTFSAAAEPAIEIVDPWVRAVPGSMTATAAYFTIKNHSSEAIQLTAGSTELAGMCTPMISTSEEKDGQEVMGMRTVETLEVPANGELALKPGGDHLMLMGLVRNPAEGEVVEIVLEFAPGDQKVSIEAPVLRDAPQS